MCLLNYIEKWAFINEKQSIREFSFYKIYSNLKNNKVLFPSDFIKNQNKIKSDEIKRNS
jgi:hypothetical protein